MGVSQEEIAEAQEEIAGYEKNLEKYNEKLNAYKEKQKVFWSEAREKAKKWWHDMPDWEDDFIIDNGSSSIYHNKNGIGIVSNLVQSFDQDGVDGEINPVKEIYLTQWQGKILKHPVRLKWHSSRNDFIIELIRSGLYKGTARELEMYKCAGNWEGKHTVVGLFFKCIGSGNKKNRIACRSIEHTKKKIILWDDKEDRIGGFCSSVELFGFGGRKIYLNHKQSPYEFMMRLIETSHVSFQEYPPYITQGRSKVDRFGKEKIYYECYYYGDIPATENPLYQASELERKMQEQKRCRKQVEKHQKLAQEISSLVINSALSSFSDLATEKEKNRKMASQTVLGNVSQDINVVEIATQKNNLLSKFLNGIRPVFTLTSNPFKNFQINN